MAPPEKGVGPSHPADAATPAQAMRELLEEVADSLGLTADVRVTVAGDTLTGTLDGEELGLLIGRHGQTIDALQHIAQRTIAQFADAPARVVVDGGGYRARRREALERRAQEAADEAASSGRPVALEPLPASERRLVHECLRDREDVETHSEGDEPARHLVVVARRS